MGKIYFSLLHKIQFSKFRSRGTSSLEAPKTNHQSGSLSLKKG